MIRTMWGWGQNGSGDQRCSRDIIVWNQHGESGSRPPSGADIFGSWEHELLGLSGPPRKLTSEKNRIP